MTIQPSLHSFIAHTLEGIRPIFAVGSGGGSSKKSARSAVASTAKKSKRHDKTPAASDPTRTSPRFHPSTNQSEAPSQEQRLGSARKTLDLSHHEGNISSPHNSDKEESNDNVTNTEPPPLPPPAPVTVVNQISLWKMALKTSFQLIMLSFSTTAYLIVPLRIFLLKTAPGILWDL